MKKIILLIFLLCFVSNLLYSLEIRLNPPQNFYLENGEILIDLNSSQALLSGEDVQNLFFDIPITVTYYVEFFEKNLFFDKELVNLQIVRRVVYDNWSKQFFIEEDGRTTKYHNLTQLRFNMLNLKKIRLIDARLIDKDKTYYFKTRISVKIKNFTLYYYLINNLISIFKYKTTYYYSKDYLGKEIFSLINNE